MRSARPAARVRIREVRSEADPGFGGGYRLLRRVFPRAEILPRREWVDVMRERNARVWTDLNWHLLVAEHARTIVGAASGAYLGNVNVGVIGYVAVERRWRSHGVGPALRRHLRVAFEGDARRIRGRPLEALVGEVKATNPWLRHLVLREGAIALDFPYYQPPLAGRGTEVPLVLYYQPLTRPRRAVPAAEVRRLLYTLWRRPYRVAKPLARPAFRRMLRALDGRGYV
ncbi:MAG: GNAT family N-acetyltransferase, partial [Gemmatimonadales bacterium]